MDLEQIINRLEWLDDERRKDKVIITALQEKLEGVEANTPEILQQINEVNSEVTRVSTMLARFDQVEESLGQLRVDLTKKLAAAEKHNADHNRDAEKIRLADQEANKKTVGKLRKSVGSIDEIKKNLQLRVEEEFRLGRLITDIEKSTEENQREDEESRRSQRQMEEGRRQDIKRMADLQGELSGLRKRADEQRAKMEMAGDSVRKMEAKVNELQAAETERQQAQNAFTEKTALMQLERDRTWKEWEERFTEISTKSQNLDTQLQSLDSTNRAIKRSQESFEEVTQRFDRRTNEITEMQRLSEERFRQEWSAFAADDQKRWTNFTLSQEERQRDIERKFERLGDRVVSLEDNSQELMDTLFQITEDIYKRFQLLGSLSGEWAEVYERLQDRFK